MPCGSRSNSSVRTADRPPCRISPPFFDLSSTQPMLVAFAAVWLLAITAFAQPPEDEHLLEPHTVVQRPLARSGEDFYRVALTKGDYVSVAVEQRGIDVVVQTRRPDGSAIADFQEEMRRQGRETVELVADTAGVYTLAIRRAVGPDGTGAYEAAGTGRQAP